MYYVVPEIKRALERYTIFLPFREISIIMIHRLIMDLDKQKLLRDVSITLALLYISHENKYKFVAEYFKLNEYEIREISIKISNLFSPSFMT